MASSVALTTAYLRKQGTKYAVVEGWNQFTKTKSDLFNIIDIIALNSRVTGIQACGTDIKQHKKKMTEEFRAISIAWIAAGGGLEVWAWRKLKAKTKDGAFYKNGRWVPRIFELTIKFGDLFFDEVERQAE